MTESDLSPAYTVLRASARRVDRLIQSELARQQDGYAVIYADQLELCGSRRVYVSAMSEIGALGLAEVTRHPKRYVCRLSNRWSEMRTMQDALIASTMAREHCNDDAGAWPSHAEDGGATTIA
jgi:hypothetical protein